jgi:hypothetical protein
MTGIVPVTGVVLVTDARDVLAMKHLMFEECKLKATVLVTLADEKGKPVKSHTIVVSGLTDKVCGDRSVSACVNLFFQNIW